MTVRTQIAEALDRAARAIGVEGQLPDLELSRTRNPAHGDYASSAGLKLARVLRRRPDEIASELVAKIDLPGGEAVAEAAGGYVNFRLRPEWLQRVVAEVAAAGPRHGSSDLGGGERVQVEYLSTNPTGPLHIGHGRGAILGDALATLLAFTGHSSGSTTSTTTASRRTSSAPRSWPGSGTRTRPRTDTSATTSTSWPPRRRPPRCPRPRRT